MAVMTIAIALIGYGFARTWRFYEKWKRDALLEAPLNLGMNPMIYNNKSN